MGGKGKRGEGGKGERGTGEGDVGDGGRGIGEGQRGRAQGNWNGERGMGSWGAGSRKERGTVKGERGGKRVWGRIEERDRRGEWLEGKGEKGGRARTNGKFAGPSAHRRVKIPGMDLC